MATMTEEAKQQRNTLARIKRRLVARGFDKCRQRDNAIRVGCSQCQAMCVNGVAIHEKGCPNEQYPEEDESKFQYEPLDLVVHKRTGEVFRVFEIRTTTSAIEGRTDTSTNLVCDKVNKSIGENRDVFDVSEVQPFVQVFVMTGNNAAKLALVALTPYMYHSRKKIVASLNTAVTGDNYSVTEPRTVWINDVADGFDAITQHLNKEAPMATAAPPAPPRRQPAPMPTPTTKPQAEAGNEQPTLFKNKNTVDMSPSEKLQKTCVGCRVSFNWFKTSRQVDKTDKKTMAVAAGSEEDGFSASKRLMDSKHPVIKEANELRRGIEGFWKSMTVPLAAFASAGKPEPGTRLIQIEKYPDFDSRMKAYRPEVAAMEKKVNDNLTDIKAMDRARLKGLYREEDYPDKISLDFSWGVVNTEIPAVLEKLDPQLYQEAVGELNERMEQTYELATVTVLESMLSVVASWVDILGPVTRIHPAETSPYAHLHGGEVREVVRHDKDPSVPEGKVKVLIRHYPNKATKMQEDWIGPMSSADYADLRPSEISSERRSFKDSTIDGMSQFLADFRNVKDVISAAPQVEEMIKQLERQLAKCGTTKEVAAELRNSSTFRQDTHRMMQQISDRVRDEITVFKKGRRLISRGLAAPQPPQE